MKTLSVLGIVLLLALGGVFWKLKVKPETKGEAPPAQETPQTQKEKDYAQFYAWPDEFPRELVDTTGWQTYTNTKYGYRIKYPPHFNLNGDFSPHGPPPPNWNESSSIYLNDLGKNEDPDQAVLFTFISRERETYPSEAGQRLFSDDESERLRQLIRRDYSNEELRPRPRIIGDELAGGFGWLTEEDQVDSHLLKHGNTVVQITVAEVNYKTQEEKKQANAIIDTILSTFKFTQ